MGGMDKKTERVAVLCLLLYFCVVLLQYDE